MKKGIQESNSALALWQRVIIDGRVHKLARSFREKLKIPLDGFELPEKYKNWYKQYKTNPNTEKYFSGFIKESKNIIPYKGIIEEFDIEIILIDLLCNNNKDYSFIEKSKHSGMDVETIKDSKVFYPRLGEYIGEIKDGVYIKLKHFSTIETIIKYVEENKSLIKKALDDYAKSIDLLKPKKFKLSSNFERDRKILFYNQYSTKELQEFSGLKYKDKNSLISSIMMKEFGPNINGEGQINIDVVKIVKQRSKLKK